jgi:hypothetical protein
MLPGRRRERACSTTNDVGAVSLDAGHRPKVFIDQAAGERHARSNARRSFSGRQLVCETVADRTHQPVNLVGRKGFRENTHELCQKRNVGLGQQLLDLCCQFEDFATARAATVAKLLSRQLGWTDLVKCEAAPTLAARPLGRSNFYFSLK